MLLTLPPHTLPSIPCLQVFTSQTCSIVADRTKAYAICPHSLLLAEAAHLKATYPDFKLGELLSLCYSWGLHVGGSGGPTCKGGSQYLGKGGVAPTWNRRARPPFERHSIGGCVSVWVCRSHCQPFLPAILSSVIS